MPHSAYVGVLLGNIDFNVETFLQPGSLIPLNQSINIQCPTSLKSKSTLLPGPTLMGKLFLPILQSNIISFFPLYYLFPDELPFWSVFPSQRIKTPRLYVEDNILPKPTDPRHISTQCPFFRVR